MRGGVPTVTLLHTSDLHNTLRPAAAAHLVELLATARQAGPALLLDSGDAVHAGNLAFSPRGEPVLRLMAETGYAAMAMGNRESHPSAVALRQKLKDATFPVLSANLVAKRGRLPEVVKPFVLLEAGGARVAVFGLTVQMTHPESAWAAVTDVVFEDPFATAQRLAPELKSQADLVVCLSHCGSRFEAQLVEMPEVDLVLGGHNHRLYIEQSPGQAMVVHPGHHGSHVSRTEIAGRDRVTSELIPLRTEP